MSTMKSIAILNQELHALRQQMKQKQEQIDEQARILFEQGESDRLRGMSPQSADPWYLLGYHDE